MRSDASRAISVSPPGSDADGRGDYAYETGGSRAPAAYLAHLQQVFPQPTTS